MENLPAIYDLKVYDDAQERETIRGLSHGQCAAFESLLARLNVAYKIMIYNQARELLRMVSRSKEANHGSVENP